MGIGAYRQSSHFQQSQEASDELSVSQRTVSQPKLLIVSHAIYKKFSGMFLKQIQFAVENLALRMKLPPRLLTRVQSSLLARCAGRIHDPS